MLTAACGYRSTVIMKKQAKSQPKAASKNTSLTKKNPKQSSNKSNKTRSQIHCNVHVEKNKKGSVAKRKPTKSVASSRNRRRQSEEDSESEDDVLNQKTLIVPSARTLKWKPVSKDTVKFVMQIMDANIHQILSRTKGPALEPVQQCLGHLHSRLEVEMSRLKAPVNTRGNYGRLQAIKFDIDKSVQENLDHVKILSAEIEKYESLIEILEKEKSRLETDMEDSVFLEEEDQENVPKDELGLPALPAESALLLGLEPGNHRHTSNSDAEIFKILSHIQAP